MIQDNILIVQEVLHKLRTRQRKKKFQAVLKLDMQKAYDRIEWDFLEACLLRLGFDSRWVHLVMRCVTTVSYSILFNGESLPQFSPSRGLRQGDPLSPYLFIMVTNMLSLALKQALQDELIKGIRLSKDCPTLTHLFFADDSILFLDGTIKECQNIAEILGRYCFASGQAINLNKSGLFFSKNSPQQLRHNMLAELRVPEISRTGKYLGIPSDWGDTKKKLFAWILDRVSTKLEGWKEKQLSRVGKDVLIKAVVQAIPQYAMTIFKVPASICRSIEKKIATFWWRSSAQHTGLHWKKWEILKIKKGEGGLGFKDLMTFNDAMLGRQAWRLLQSPSSLWGQVLKGLYFPTSDFECAKKGARPSWGWQSLLMGRDAILPSTRWVVGDGRKIKIRESQWLSHGVMGGPANRHEPMLVAELITEETKEWKESLVTTLYDEKIAREILAIPLSLSAKEDRLVWTPSRSGIYSVKSGYNSIKDTESRRHNPTASSSHQIPRVLWTKIWGANTSPKIRFFLWSICQNALPTKDNLSKRRIVQDHTCDLCHQQAETIEHLFLLCPWTQNVWRHPEVQICISPLGLSRIDEWLGNFDHPVTSFDQLALLLWHIWKARNNSIFRNHKPNPHMLVSLAVAEYRGGKMQTLGKKRKSKDSFNSPQIWRRPPHEALKINIDGSFFAETLEGAISCVCRNKDGNLVDGFAKKVRSRSAEHTELLALLETLRFLQSRAEQKLQLETDCEMVLKTLQGDVESSWDLDVLFAEVKSLLMGFKDLSLAHCARTANHVADWVAKACFNGSLPLNWIVYPPAPLWVLLISDLGFMYLPP